MATKDKTLNALNNRIESIEEKIKSLRADLAEAKRMKRQQERLAEIERAEAFYKRFGHLEEKLRATQPQTER